MFASARSPYDIMGIHCHGDAKACASLLDFALLFDIVMPSHAHVNAFSVRKIPSIRTLKNAESVPAVEGKPV